MKHPHPMIRPAPRRPGLLKAASAALPMTALAALLLAVTAALPAQAEPATALSSRYRQECSACHVAYPPGMLPSASWQRLMDHLPRHFGTDASLDPATVKALSGWLASQAGSSRRFREEPPQDRITRSAWFVREHDEIATATWKRASIKSASNCAACHTQADQGVFDEHDVHIPR